MEIALIAAVAVVVLIMTADLLRMLGRRYLTRINLRKRNHRR
ncbi:hypothetical protein ABMA57_17885 [Saccharospirillum sp. HFRX-1]